MSHFAEVINGRVERVIVAEQDFIDSGAVGDPANWIQTSYNSRIRNMFAQPGFVYDKERDVFYPPQPYPSWLLQPSYQEYLDENNNIVSGPKKLNWIAPVKYPPDFYKKVYNWNEDLLKWEES